MFISSLRRRRLALLLSGIVLGATVPHAVQAQRAAAPATVLAIADSLPIADARAVVLFRARPSGQHVILVSPSSATPETVGGAMALIARLEHEHVGDDHSAVVPISGVASRRPLAAPRRAELDAFIRAAAMQPRTRLGDAGVGRWVELRSRAPDRR